MGVIKINGVTYGGGDNSVMLTQAEYDALVEAGTVDPTVLYMITDKNSENTAYAATVSYANTDSGLSATNVQDAIDELAETGGGAGVSVLTYAEYQELVDAGEVNPDISYYISDSNTTGTNYAAGISYDNTESGMTATDVQEAIDELAPVKASISNIDNVTITSPAVGDTLTWNGSAWVNTRAELIFSGTISSTETSKNLISGKKFSDYSEFVLQLGATDTFYRASTWFSKDTWTTGCQALTQFLHGNSGAAVTNYSITSVTITYNTDTTFKAQQIGYTGSNFYIRIYARR